MYMEAIIGQLQLREMLCDPQRQEQGFRLLMKQYGEKLYWHIRRIVVGHDDAEDAMQETAIRVFSGIKSYKGEGELTSWLYRIATHEALRQLKRKTRLFESIDSLAPRLTATLQAEATVDGSATELLLQKALLTLPTQQRIVFNMRYYDELSYSEMADITGKNVGTLKTNYHYATERIKQYIKEHTE